MAQETEETKEAPPPKSSRLKLIIILVVVLALLGGGGFVGYTMFFKKGAETHAETPAVLQPVIQDLDTFLVNLSDPGGKRYLKVTMKLKLNGQPASVEFASRTFELRDAILTTLSSKEVEDITRPEDKTNLKQELMMQLNRVLKQGQVQDVYFTDFLIQ